MATTIIGFIVPFGLITVALRDKRAWLLLVPVLSLVRLLLEIRLGRQLPLTL
jgi:hypothetical protein